MSQVQQGLDQGTRKVHDYYQDPVKKDQGTELLK